MRRLLLGAIFLTLVVAVWGVVRTWPRPAGDPARNSPTLAEFQRGIRVAQSSEATRPAAPRAAQPSVAIHPPQTMTEASLQPFRIASAQAMLPVSSIGENVPEHGMPQAAGPALAPNVPKLDVKAAGTPEVSDPQPAKPVTLAVANAATPPAAPEPVPAAAERLAQPAAVILATTSPAAGPTEPPAQAPHDPPNVQRQPPTAAHHAERISVHYHNDSRSAGDAQRLSGRLGSAGYGRVELHTTAHIIPASLVRYFTRQDASSASALAKSLAGKGADWRVDDCTAYRHKPEHGTIELWPATAGGGALAAH
jgi:hypothetical protein